MSGHLPNWIMTLRSWFVLMALALCPASLATPAWVAGQLSTQLGGIAQVCPPAYVEATCVQVSGGIVSVAGQISAVFPNLVPESWWDGPEGGLSTEVESEITTLHLVPQGEEQTLMILQSWAAAAGLGGPTPTAVTAGPFVVENPDGNYFVILNGDQLVTDPSALPAGTYSMIVSGSGKATRQTTLTVPSSGWKRLTVPRLAAAPARADRAALQLPDAPGYVFVVYTGGGTPVLDLADMLPGYYDIRSFWQGEAGPVAYLQELKLGQLTRPQFRGTFSQSKATTPVLVAPSLPTVAPVRPTVAPAPASSGSSGMCYVNGYRRSNGTYVSGYYRRC